MMKAHTIGALFLLLGAAGLAQAQAPYQPQSAQPPKDAGYLLPDGSVQIVGWQDLAGLFARLNVLYERTHPGTRLRYVSGNLVAPQHALIFDETAFAPTGVTWNTVLNTAYKPMVKAPTFSVRIAHGAVKGDGIVGPLAFIVNKANPIDRLSHAQLQHIFTVGGRAPDVSLWKQAGLKGELGEHEIHAYGLPPADHYPSADPGFGPHLFRDTWGYAQAARNYRMQPTYADVTRRVSEDADAIGVTTLNRVTPDVKVLGLTAGDWGAPMRGTREDIASGRYPYDRFLYVFVRRGPDAPIDPFVKEYLRMIFSREGQQAIAEDAKGYIPLNPAELAAELAKLD